MDKLIMSKKELEQAKVFTRLKDNQISKSTAAKMLGISTRWVRKKLRRYLEKGDAGLLHLGRGKPSGKRFNVEHMNFAMQLLRTDWKDFGPTFAAEKLASEHRINISAECLRQAMLREGLWVKKRRRSQHRKRRERKGAIGIMVQFDGSPHNWFEGRAPWATLLVFIDDATSKFMWLEFAESESTESAMKAIRNYLLKHGIPCSMYTDFGSVFSVNTNNPERDKKTQFGRALEELGIKLIFAHSPQAKGRVERANKTLQDRLVKEMRLAGISSIEAANTFLQKGDFIDRHNQQFAQPPAEKGDAHKSLDGFDLDKVLCIKESRIVANDYTISYKSRILQIQNDRQATVRPKDTVLVMETLEGALSLYVRSTQLEFTELAPRPKRKLSPVNYVNQVQDDDPSCSTPAHMPFLGETYVDVQGLGAF